MSKVFDGADYTRKLEQAGNVSVATEAKYIIKGEADAPAKMMEAKRVALLKARKEMLQAVDNERKKLADELIPVEVEEVLTGKGDELVQV